MQDVNSLTKGSSKNNFQEVSPNPAINHEYLNKFCEAISDETLVDRTPFKQVYESKITYFTPFLQSEVMKNLSHLSRNKKDNYLSFVIDKIARTPYYGISKSEMIEILMDYDLTIDEFPNLSDPEMDSHLSNDYFTEQLSILEYDSIYNLHQSILSFFRED